MSDAPSLLLVDEVKERLRCSRRRVFQLLADGTLTRGPRYGRETVITVESVEAALAAPPVEEPPVRASRRTRQRRRVGSLEELSKPWA